MVGGFNHQGGIKRGDADYYYSKYIHIGVGLHGGIVGKKHMMLKYQTGQILKSQNFLKKLQVTAPNIATGLFFNRLFLGKIDAWDYQWFYANWKYERLRIMPNINLICNIGAGEAATHAKFKSDIFDLPTFDLEFPLAHPIAIKPNFLADCYTAIHSYSIGVKTVGVELIKRILMIMGININSKYFKKPSTF